MNAVRMRATRGAQKSCSPAALHDALAARSPR
jgi:hypothetical protein